MDPMENPTGAAPAAGVSSPADPTAEGLRAVADQVEQSHGVGKNKGGRPKGVKDSYPRAKRTETPGPDLPPDPGTASAGVGQGLPPGPPPVVIPPALLAKIGKRAAEVLDRFNVGRVKKAAKTAGVSPEEAGPIVEAVRMSDQDKDLVGELTPFVVEEMGAGDKLSPTAGLAVVLLTNQLGVMAAIQALEKEAPPPITPPQ